ncbi:SDR family NAD(P)-dependent oxidoreductase [Paraburkholderia fungorum]|uniref:SDR family NAD(P)-dependent oxidoreductase n=1 Tax=Paraburkholderia fungorum TaxID=134537 RepID=UPI0038BDE3C8
MFVGKPDVLLDAIQNRHIQWSRLPVKVTAEAQPWPDGKKVASVSSFGFSGTNAHVVVEEYVAPPGVQRAWVGPVAVVLSARNGERLQVQVEQLRAYLETHEVRLLDLAYTLQVGREAMGTRLAWVVDSMEALKDRLADYEPGEAHLEGVYRGELKRSQQTLAALTADDEFQETIDKWLARGKVDRLAQIWAQGLTVEWEKLYGQTNPQRISLPTYPFARERYWVPQDDRATPESGSFYEHRLHPLVHRNTSDLSEQRYSTTLSGDEFFVSEHGVRGQQVVPGVVQLEWARAAASMALGRSSSEFAIRLTQVNWMRPLAVNEPLEVHVGLTQEEDGRAGYEIYSGEGDDAVVYSHGWAQVVSADAAPRVDLVALRAKCGRTVGRPECYARLAAAGLSYGPSFIVLTALEVGDGVVVGALQRATDTFEEGYSLPPSLMDGALQASMELATTDGGLALPFAVQAVEQWGAVPSPAWAVVRPGAGDSAAMRKLDVEIVDEAGQVAVRLSGFSTRMLEQQEQTLLLAPRWTAQAIPMAAHGPVYGVHRVLVCEMRVPDRFEAELAPAQCVRLNAAGTLAERYCAYAEQLLAQVRQITADKPIYPVLLQLVVPLSGDGAVLQGLSALLLSARAEFPTLVIQTVAVEDSSELVPRLRAEAMSPAPAVRYGPRGRELLDFTERHTFEADVPWRDGGVYWITGGLGGLGQIFARALAQGARGLTLVLSGRSALTAEHEVILQGLRAQGARVEYRAVDVSDGRGMALLAQDIVARYGQLNGVIHCAGVLRDSLLVNGTDDDLQQVLEAKVAGLVALDAATRTITLDWLVLCSSVASSWGNVGQAGYAAANGFMDSYAVYRESLVAQGQRYGRMVSVSWPLWAEGGMKVDAGVAAQLRRGTGMQAMPEEAGVKALGQALAQTQTSPHMMVLYGERARLLAHTQAAGGVPALQAPVETAMPEPGMQEDAELAARVERVLTGLISTHLKIEPEKLERDTPLNEFGLDSITLTSFSHVLNERYGLMLSPTVFFEAPTISALARYLAREHSRMLSPAFAPANTRRETVEPSPVMPRDVTGRRCARRSIARTSAAHGAPVPSTLEPIAVIGMSGSFPQAPDIDTLWTNLRAGRDCIGELPASRFGEAAAPAIRHAGVLDGVDEFDPLFFGISPREARRIDPQQRLLMTYVHKAIEDAGYSVQSLSGSATALLVGTVTSGYGQMLAQAGEAVTGSSVAGLVGSTGPNRMSYWLNWHGPSEPVETACSSSLVAVHRAVTLLRSGQCAQAVVGGVNTLLSSEAHESFTQAGMLSLDGRCKAFSAQANGYVRAEGVGMLFLKPLSAAQRDGDHIYGLILGSAQNHGGRANSLSAPNPLAQARLVETAFRQAGVDPRTVGYIEAHGTGTALGDPVEVQGLKRAFRNLTKAGSLPAASIGLGTVKSNIGHLELAAGVAGLIKVLLQMRHGQLVKSLYSEPPNPQIDLKGSPFYVVNDLRTWEAPVDEAGRELPRRAGVSSFGFGGVNAHVVVEEYVAPPGVQRAWVEPVAVVLSAKNAERLQVQVEQLRAYLETHEVRLLDLAYTLQVGREAMGTRLAWVVDSMEALKDRLADYEPGEAHLEGVYRGELKRSQQTLAALTADDEFQETIDKWLARGKVDRLAQIWAQGLTVAWEKLYGEAKPQRISLPTYPFARERYWVPQDDRATPEPGVSGLSSDTARLTLPGRRLDLPFSREIRFELPLSRRNPAYLAEHCLFGATVVPAAFHLSLVLAALQALAPLQACELADILFSEALILDDEPTIVQLILDTANGRPTRFDITSQSSSGWTVHASGRIAQLTTEAAPATTLALPPGDGAPISGADFYRRHASSGYIWGRAFQWLEQIWPGADEAWGRIPVARPEQAVGDSPLFAGLVDSWFHLMMNTAQWRALPEDILRIPFSIEKFSFWGTASNSEPLWASAGDKALALFDETGRSVARVEGFEFRELHRADLESALRGDVSSRLYEITWQPDDRIAQAAIPGVIVLAADGGDRLAEKLRLPGVTVTVLDKDVMLSRRCETLAQILAATSGPLWLVTRGAIDTDPAQSALWGLARAVAVEHTTVALQLIDLDPSADDATDLAALTDVLAHGADREQAAYRDGRRLVARLTRLPRARNETRPMPALHADATYLVTGGLGALGHHVAMWLVARGAKNIVLAGRRVPGENAGGASNDSQIRVVETDVADPSRVQALIALIADEMPPLRGVIHAAGLLDDAPLAEQSRERFEAVMAPKATGALNLDNAIANLPLDFFVCFSSVASLLGAQGQANYAAANAFVDGLMQQRRARGYHGLSVNWGPWAETGMAARLDPVLRRRVTEQGYDFLAPVLGIEALERLLSADVTQACVVSMNWTQHARSLVNRVPLPLLSRLLPQQSHRVGETAQKLRNEIVAATAPERVRLVSDYFSGELIEVLGISSSQPIDPQQGFNELGLDSLMSIELRNRVSRDLDMPLSATVIFEYPTLNLMTEFLVNRIAAHDASTTPAVSPAQDHPIESDAIETAVGALSDAELAALIEREWIGLEGR